MRRAACIFDGMLDYGYPIFERPDQTAFRGAPKPGDPMPDFELPTIDGRTIRKADFITDKPVLVTLASITCPSTAAARDVLKKLHKKLGDRVEFVTIYVREALPSEHYPHPQNLAQKIHYARDYQRRDTIPWTVAVDDTGGRMHRLLGGLPNAAYVMALDGTVAARVISSHDERALERALRSVVPQQPAAFLRNLAAIASGMLGVLAARALIRGLLHRSRFLRRRLTYVT